MFRQTPTTAPPRPITSAQLGFRCCKAGPLKRPTEDRPLVAVISASAAQRFWPNRNPIGERFAITDAEIAIVGVVGDVRAAALDRAPQPTIYVPYRQDPWPSMVFTLRFDGSAYERRASLQASVRDAIWQVDKDQPIGAILTMDEQL